MQSQYEFGTFTKPTILGKLTMKTMGIVPAKCNEKKYNGQAAPLCKIYGNAMKLKPYTMDDGTQTFAVIGTFEAVDSETGEVFRSSRLFLPEGVHETLIDAVKVLPDDPAASVTFGFDVRSVPSASPAGYSYQTRPLLQNVNSDPLSALRGEIGAAIYKGLPPAAQKQLVAGTSAAPQEIPEAAKPAAKKSA